MDICRPPVLRSSSTQPCRWQISTCPHTSKIMLCPYCFVAGWRSTSYSTSMGTCLCAKMCWKASMSQLSLGHATRSGSPVSNLPPECLARGISEHPTPEYNGEVYHTIKAGLEPEVSPLLAEDDVIQKTPPTFIPNL
ncbi:hypothetical protein E3U43_003959 [Larimichthys crocea]|uniref:Uncharacterized protein n=1 Tax=Larimichthys crocea TaxID=215358 RepID=A0ACD3RKB3_LARCR|nr:hypothetical protein E3U43_003959 [Larimichthys crocea]